MKLNIFNTILLSVFVFIFFLTLTNCFYIIYISKNFDYILELSCKPEIEKCFIRDCSNPSDCPPNNLSVYKQLYLTAKYFKQCTDDSCEDLYQQNPNIFRKIDCDTEKGDECVGVGINEN